MSAFYAKRAALAAKKIAKFGAAVVLCRTPLTGEYDPGTASPGQGVEVRHPCKAVLSLPGSICSGVRFNDGSTVLAGDKIAILGVPEMPFIPAVGDTLEIKGESWTVVQEMHVQPGGEYVLFKVLVRK